MEANQNSNSPNDLTEMMLVSVSTIIRINAQVHWGTPGTQRFMMRAPAVASMPSTMIQNHAYSQPIEKPAHRPMALSAYEENEPVSGDAPEHSPRQPTPRLSTPPPTPVETK